jgi:hypothetical protein
MKNQNLLEQAQAIRARVGVLSNVSIEMIAARVSELHLGPGNHPSGSSQAVHAGGDARGIREMGGMMEQLQEGGFSHSLAGKSPTSGYIAGKMRPKRSRYGLIRKTKKRGAGLAFLWNGVL